MIKRFFHHEERLRLKPLSPEDGVKMGSSLLLTLTRHVSHDNCGLSIYREKT